MSPFNTNGAGIPKSADEILAELRIERGIWLTADVTHHAASKRGWWEIGRG